jgi:hypothetical protein
MVKRDEHEIKPRNNLIAARLALELSQADAGGLIGRGEFTVRHFEAGHGAYRARSKGTLRELCEAYKATAQERNDHGTGKTKYDMAKFELTWLCPGEFNMFKEME